MNLCQFMACVVQPFVVLLCVGQYSTASHQIKSCNDIGATRFLHGSWHAWPLGITMPLQNEVLWLCLGPVSVLVCKMLSESEEADKDNSGTIAADELPGEPYSMQHVHD